MFVEGYFLFKSSDVIFVEYFFFLKQKSGIDTHVLVYNLLTISKQNTQNLKLINEYIIKLTGGTLVLVWWKGLRLRSREGPGHVDESIEEELRTWNELIERKKKKKLK